MWFGLVGSLITKQLIKKKKQMKPCYQLFCQRIKNPTENLTKLLPEWDQSTAKLVSFEWSLFKFFSSRDFSDKSYLLDVRKRRNSVFQVPK